jgi:glycosyltransferase involved in cell wall biosynthesis
MTELSIVCAYRDAAAYLPDLLASLTRAVVPGTQVVFVDDGSVDRSLDVIDRFTPHLDADVDVIVNGTPAGPAAARNAGMRVADGRIIAFVDGDDWVGPGYFSEMIQWIDALDVDFVRCDHVRVTPQQRSIGRAPDARYHRRLDPRSAVLPADRSTMVDFPYSHSGAFHRRLLDAGLLEMPSHLRTAEDRPWIWRLHLEAGSYARIASLQYFYRRDVATSLTRVGDDRQLDFIPSFEAVLEYVLGNPDFAEFRPKAVRQCLSVVHHHLVNAERLHPGLEESMRERLRSLLRLIPDDEMSLALAALDRGRRGRIRDLDRRLHAL